MAVKRKRTATETARRYLSGAIFREDSDDELGLEDHPWEWIYDNGPSGAKIIVGARMGAFECRRGDTVLLKAEGNAAWVGIICYFLEDEEDEDREKMANFMWFSSEKEIVNKKKRTDCLENELYITPAWDNNSLTTINGKATVISHDKFMKTYPNGKITRNSRDHDKVFFCRRGCNTRTATYTEEFNWHDIYGGVDDLQPLVERIQHQTKASRKRSKQDKADLDEFVAKDDGNEDGLPKTPRKRRKLDGPSTPGSRTKHRTPSKLTTPTHKRIAIKKPLEFTPLGTRILSPHHTQSSPYQIARTHLHVSAVPTSLQCREEEFANVYTQLEAAITDGTGSCIYISGTPGTGKTATVREVIAQLNASVQAEELDDFIFVEINGMKVTDPHQAYSLLWEALRGDRVSPSHALTLLEQEFSTPSPRRVPCVVLMDELDQLVTRSQSVMYNFFNWPGLRHSRLIVLAVANTMDLPERTLSNKISSRLGLRRITFPGYTHTQLINIIESRLANVPGSTVVHPDAIQFASRKVAAVSGDARRALDICRRAVELAESDAEAMVDSSLREIPAPNTPSKTPGRKDKPMADTSMKATPPTVTISTIKRAIAEATSSPLHAALRALPLSAKVFLAALLARIRRTGIGEAVLGDVLDEARRMGIMAVGMQPVQDFMLAPGTNEDYVGSVDEGAGAGAGLLGTPGKRGRLSIRKEPNSKAARLWGLGAAAAELAEAGIVGLENRKGERVGRVRLGVGEEEIRDALREDESVQGLGFG
ncbi:MAG: Origin recognition complex, subunit 1 [Bathelium mastoideum]|nr:MAG: Origin recognition complex, subunit 1 [Bathelium mastoideum]KAI9691831.1 MAG: Origin recognition complex, subunit 1 [Bathelium mastoideum]